MEKKPKKKTQVLAHSRRQRENDTFTDIAQALPIQENAKDLDKASILRLAIHYLKLKDLLRDGSEQLDIEGEEEGEGEEGMRGDGEAVSPTALFSEETAALLQSDPNIADFLPNFSKDVVQALDGFLLVISRDGRVLFSSDSIANYLGLRQVDVIGVNIQDIIHPQDCSEMVRIFQTGGNDSEQVCDPKEPLRRKFVARMRCAFTPSVRCITRCSNFKPIYCSCFLKFGKSGAQKGQFLGVVTFCKLATLSKIKEMVVGTFFKTKHSLDLSYTNVDTRIRWILGYDPSEMTGLKAYQYFHPQDLGVTSSCHMNLLSRGVSHSPCYRFMTRWGDWVWCRSKSQMVFNKNSHLPEGIVIYTWIVRVDEEDDRMLAIKSGEDGEKERKTYEAFSSNISAATGDAFDVNELANPFGKPTVATPSPQQVTNEPNLPYSPPLSAESSPLKSQMKRQRPSDCTYGSGGVAAPPTTRPGMVSNSPIGLSSPPMGMGVSSPPMGVGVSCPPMGVAVSSPPMSMTAPSMGMGVSSPPMGVGVSSPQIGMGVSSPPMGMNAPSMGVGVSSPPMNVGVSSPPMGLNAPSMGMGVSSPPMNVGVSSPPMNVGVSSPPMGMTAPSMGMGVPSPLTGLNTPPSSTMTDYSSTMDPFLPQSFSSDVADQSFLFDQSTPLNQGFMPSPPYTPYSSTQPPASNPGASPPYCNYASPPYSKGTPSPQSSCSFQNDSYSPYSSTATPLCDQMIPNSTPSQIPPQQPMNQYVNQQTTPTTTPMSKGMFVNSIASMIGPPPQNIPGPSLEVTTTFIPNGNSSSNLSRYSESVSMPMGPEMSDLFNLSGVDFSQKAILPSLTHAPPHVRQTVIQNTRQRYSGATPTAAGRAPSATMVLGHANASDADSSISQWSQWLKGSAPAPVC